MTSIVYRKVMPKCFILAGSKRFSEAHHNSSS